MFQNTLLKTSKILEVRRSLQTLANHTFDVNTESVDPEKEEELISAFKVSLRQLEL